MGSASMSFLRERPGARRSESVLGQYGRSHITTSTVERTSACGLYSCVSHRRPTSSCRRKIPALLFLVHLRVPPATSVHLFPDAPPAYVLLPASSARFRLPASKERVPTAMLVPFLPLLSLPALLLVLSPSRLAGISAAAAAEGSSTGGATSSPQ
jgi:hypothetical protein